MASPTPPAPAPTGPPTPASDHSFLSPRSLKQLGLFCAGAGFMVGSVAITRRAIARRRIAAMPAFHHATVPLSSSASTTTTKTTRLTSRTIQSPPKPTTTFPSPSSSSSSTTKTSEEWRAEGSMLAFEALSLATLNVFAFAVALTGGLAWAFDISTVDDMRARARRRLYGQTGGEAVSDENVDREIEEWAAGVLARIGVVKGEEGEDGGEAKGKEDGKRE